MFIGLCIVNFIFCHKIVPLKMAFLFNYRNYALPILNSSNILQQILKILSGEKEWVSVGKSGPHI